MSALRRTLDYMARPTDASSDTGGDAWKVPDYEKTPDDAVTTATGGGLMDQVEGSESGDIDYGINLNAPPRLRESADLEEGATKRAELATFLEKLPGADNRDFTPEDRVTIGCEIEALHVEVRELTNLNLRQQEAIDQLLEEVRRGSERMGRKDWVTYAIGAATSVVIMETVPPLVLLPLAAHAIHALGPLLIGPGMNLPR